jgi:hypothetical protein
MSASWEYIRDEASASGPPFETGKVLSQASDSWIAKLNKLGSDGWELVSERRRAVDISPAEFCARYEGTLKRPRR